MKIWFLGKEISYFKPLKNELDRRDIEVLTIDEKLGFSEEKKKEIVSNIYNKGFLDPNYINYVRTSTQLFFIDNFTIKEIFLIKDVKDFSLLPNKEILPTHYVDFIKSNKPILHLEREGLSIHWIEEDLKYKGIFKEKIENSYIFETIYFRYKITKDFLIEDVYSKLSKSKVKSISWRRKEAFLFLEEDKIEHVKDYYIRWLSALVNTENLNIEINCPTEKIDSNTNKYKDFLSYDLHPYLIDLFDLEGKSCKEFKKIIKDDIEMNGEITLNSKDFFTVKSWKFNYIWIKGILSLVELPSSEKISSINWTEDSIIVNKKNKISITQLKPEKITDLYIGNKVSLLAEGTLDNLEFHPHAIQRYSQRIDSKAFLSQMLKDVIHNSYYFGEVVEGAHTSDRRKIETSQFGYIISDTLVISVWDKLSSKRKK